MWYSTQILQGNLASLSFPLLEGETAFCFGLYCFVDHSSEGVVFFLFFLFLPSGFFVDCTYFIAVVGRAVDLVEGSTDIWEM